MPNIYEPEFDEPRPRPGFDVQRARLGYRAGARRLGISLWELPPGRVSAAERRPDGGGLKLMFRIGDAVDYWDGESPPER